MTNVASAGEPLVSVIIPVYNVEDYLRFTLDSTLIQGIEPSQIEIIAIDDGSTDQSAAILDAYAVEHDNIKVLHQNNSGGPGNPRNRGIGVARGKYLFFLDADDELTENALRDLVNVAEAEGADIVLGKGEGINGRVVPGPVFRATKLDADLIDDDVYRTLSPWKLFRKSLVDESQIRFCETIRIGEDQPFVARAYLRARKISVLADRVYARLRARGDGTNVTASSRSVKDFMELAEAVVGVIVAETEPGRIRDGMLARPLKRTLRPVLQSRLLRLPESEQLEAVAALSDLLKPYYNDVVAGHLGGIDRVKMDLAVEADVRTLREVIRWEDENPTELYTRDNAGIVYNMPEELRKIIGTVRVEAGSLVVTTDLRSLNVSGPVMALEAEVTIRGFPERAPSVSVRLRGRESGGERDIPAMWVNSNSCANDGRRFEFKVDARDLADDVWDLFVVQEFNDQEVVRRFGARRSAELSAGVRFLRDGATPVGVAYFTRGRGYLSLDVGMRIAAHRLPVAAILGFVQRNDDVMAIISVSSPTDVQAAMVKAGTAGTRGCADAAVAREMMPLSAGVYGLPLRTHDLVGLSEFEIRVENEVGHVRAASAPELVEPISVPGMTLSLKPGGSHRFLVHREGFGRTAERVSKMVHRAYSKLTRER